MDRAEKILSEFATPDVIFRRDFLCGKTSGALLFHPDLTDAEALRATCLACEKFDGKEGLEALVQRLLIVSEAEYQSDYTVATSHILSGDAAVFVDGKPGIIIVNTRKYEKRAVTEPPTETVVKGPREGFIEDIKTNLSLLSKRLRTPALAVEKMQIGTVSSSTVALVYISTVADPKLVARVREKLKAIKIDAVTDSYYIQSYLEEHPLSIFAQAGSCEKPDVAAGKLLEGRVAIVCDGSPIVITVPFLLIEDFHSSEDYYERHSFATLIRIMRLLAVIFAVGLPGLYVSLQIFHYEIVPMKFLITLLNAIKGIPLPPLLEVLFVLLLFEIIREASVRMPRSVGTAMSIVGALVLGDTAVKAGIISSPSVMIVALSSMALYTVPDQVGTLSLLRIVFSVVGGLCGLFGLIVALIFLVHYLATLDSLGAPYLAPFAPLIPADLKDSFVKGPGIFEHKRPKSIRNINEVRRK